MYTAQELEIVSPMLLWTYAFRRHYFESVVYKLLDDPILWYLSGGDDDDVLRPKNIFIWIDFISLFKDCSIKDVCNSKDFHTPSPNLFSLRLFLLIPPKQTEVCIEMGKKYQKSQFRKY